MKRLIIEKDIHSCLLCYWLREEEESGDLYESCVHPAFPDQKAIWDVLTIPDWCPLPEADG